MDEHIFAAAASRRLNEPITLGRVEPFYFTGSHFYLPYKPPRYLSRPNTTSAARLPDSLAILSSRLISEDDTVADNTTPQGKLWKSLAKPRPPSPPLRHPAASSPAAAGKLRGRTATDCRRSARG